MNPTALIRTMGKVKLENGRGQIIKQRTVTAEETSKPAYKLNGKLCELNLINVRNLIQHNYIFDKIK